MKILIVGLNFWPDLVGVGKYTGEMAASLGAAGHDVRVVAGPAYYPAWRREKGSAPFAYRRERIELSAIGPDMLSSSGANKAVEVWRCPVYVPRQPTGLRRLLHLGSFAASSFPVLALQALWRPHVVIAVAPTLFSAPGALLAARAAHGAAWLHIQDFELDAAYELGLLRAEIPRRIVNILEGSLLRQFDRVSTISVAMRERLLRKGVVPERAVLLPNWVDTKSIYPEATRSVFRAELGIDDGRRVALYSGAMGAKQGLELIIEAARALQSDPVEFVLCGDGPARAGLQTMARGLANVRFIPLQPLPLLNELLNLADIHLLPQRADVADLVMPSKLAGMLASGRPVVATADAGTQVSRVVEECGFVVAPGDTEAFTRAISVLARDSTLRAELGAIGRARAEKELSRDRILGELNQELVALAGG